MKLDFHCITQNDPAACAIGEAQLSVDVTTASNGGTDFLFTNVDNNDLTLAGGIDPDPTIKQIYFDTDLFTTELLTGGEPEGTFNLSFVGWMNGSETSFDRPGLAIPGNMSPPGLPGGNTVGFIADFGAEYRGANTRGIQEGGLPGGEWFKINVSILTLDTFMMALDDNNFDIGLHVGALGAGSESFTLRAPSPIPLPAAVWLFGSALLGLAGLCKRRKLSSP